MAEFRVLDQVVATQVPNLNAPALPPMWADNTDMNISEESQELRFDSLQRYLQRLLSDSIAELILHHWLFPSRPVSLG